MSQGQDQGHDVNRRQVLRGLTTGLTVAAVIPIALLPTGCGPGARELEQLARQQTHPVAELGRMYLEQSGEPAERQLLAKQLLDSLEGGMFDPLPEQLEQRMRRDFADGDIVDLDGWQLSRTEARLFALAAVVQNPK